MASRLQQFITPEKETPTITTTGSRLNLISQVQTTLMEEKPISKFFSTKEILKELKIDPFSLKADPRKAINTAWDTLKETIKTSAPKILNLFPPIFPSIGISGITQKEPSKEIGEKLETTAAAGHIIFSPISAFFEGANEIPVLGSISRLISLPFVAVGEAGSEISGEIVDKLPIPERDKENIKPGIQEITALAGQLVLGKITHIGTKKVKELKTRFGEKDAQTIINKAQEFAEQAKEPIPEAIEIPKIAPEVPKETIKIKPKRKYIEIPREQLPIRMEEAEKGVSTLEARMKGIFETENVKRAKAEAEARGLDISIYDKMSKPEQIRDATKYVSKTSQVKVLEVLEGKREAPKGLLHNAIAIALEEKSLRDRNVDLAIKLASLRSTRMGQEISILTEVGALSPVSGLHEIIRTRRSVAEKKLKQGETIQTKKSSVVKEIKTKQTKFQLKMSEAIKILEDITC